MPKDVLSFQHEVFLENLGIQLLWVHLFGFGFRQIPDLPILLGVIFIRELQGAIRILRQKLPIFHTFFGQTTGRFQLPPREDVVLGGALQEPTLIAALGISTVGDGAFLGDGVGRTGGR